MSFNDPKGTSKSKKVGMTKTGRLDFRGISRENFIQAALKIVGADGRYRVDPVRGPPFGIYWTGQ